jgi:large subunit ribosomal protein L25
MNAVKISGEPRGDFGKQATANLKRDGKIPCVIYGGDEVRHFHIEETAVKPLIYTPDFNVIEVELDGKTYRTVIKDIQFHPVKENVEHMDFQELVPGRKVKVSVPVSLVGASVGVKDGGSLVTVVRKLQIKATPENLVNEIIGDITALKLSQSICVRDMQVPEGVEILQDAGTPVGYIEVPRSLKSAESSAAKLGVTSVAQEAVEEEEPAAEE